MENQQSNQNELPYWTSLKASGRHFLYRGQAPGHGGRLPRRTREIFDQFDRYDLSVVRGLDKPTGGRETAWRRAEKLCADLYHAADCRYLMTGASHAAQAMTKALVASAGRRGIVAGNCHISIVDALTDVGAQALFVAPERHPLGFATYVSAERLKRALEQQPDWVIMSTPSYEGYVGPIRDWVKLAHDHGCPIFIDQAWCPEMDLSDRLPVSALQAGADLVSSSPHKTMYSPGMTAWVFRGHGSRVPADVFEDEARKEHSTSKSAPFLAATDVNRWEAWRRGKSDIERSIEAIEKARRLVSPELFLEPDGDAIPYRVVFQTCVTGYRGFEISDLVEDEFKCQVAQPNILFACCGFGIGATRSIYKTFRAFDTVCARLPRRPALDITSVPTLSPRDELIEFGGLIYSRTENVPWAEAVGRRSRYALGAYPPGYCVVVPGSVITGEKLAYIDALRSSGAMIYGAPGSIPAGYVSVLK